MQGGEAEGFFRREVHLAPSPLVGWSLKWSV